MLRYKFDVLDMLKKSGYTTTRIRAEKVLAQKTLTDMRKGKVSGSKTIDTLCRILEVQPGALVMWVPDEDE